MPLDEYARKRDFEKTDEPDPFATIGRSGPLRFVIQKHAATRLHYDLRLEWDGALKSWAVPKGPSAKYGEKRMAAVTPPAGTVPLRLSSARSIVTPPLTAA